MLTRPTAVPQGRNMQTFSTIAVPGVHIESVTCERYHCERWEKGWRTTQDESTPLGRVRADYIRRVTRRRGWTETKDEQGRTVFTFPAGTPCFQDGRDLRAQQAFSVGPHRRRVRPALHVVSKGRSEDVARQIATKGRPAEIIRTHRPQDWIEHAAESWNRMADAINR